MKQADSKRIIFLPTLKGRISKNAQFAKLDQLLVTDDQVHIALDCDSADRGVANFFKHILDEKANHILITIIIGRSKKKEKELFSLISDKAWEITKASTFKKIIYIGHQCSYSEAYLVGKLLDNLFKQPQQMVHG